MQLKDLSKPRHSTHKTATLMSRSAATLGFATMALGLSPLAPAHAQTRVYPTDLTNIALAANGGRVISASSTLDNDPNFNANNLIDGKIWDGHTPGTSGWASNKFDPLTMDSVTIGFKDNAVKTIGKIVLNPSSAVAPERWAKDVEVQVSTENAEGPYRTVSQITLRKAGERQEFLVLPAPARFVRLLFRSNWGSDRAVALGEVEIYEAITRDDPMYIVISQLESAIADLKHYRDTQAEIGSVGGATTTQSKVKVKPKKSEFQDVRDDDVATTTANGEIPSPLSPATVQLIQQTTGGDAPGLPTSKVNIAAAANGGRIADSSSTFVSDPAQGPDPAYGPNNLIDGENFFLDKEGKPENSNGWASEGFAPGRQWVTIGFKDDRTRLISKIIVNPSSNQSDLRWARRVDVQVTSDNAKTGPFRTVTTLNLRHEAQNQEFNIRPVEAKYVRFVFTANGPGDIPLANADPDVNSDRSVSLGEIELYEPTAAGDALESLIGRFTQVLVQLKSLRGETAAKTNQTNASTLETTPGGIAVTKMKES